MHRLSRTFLAGLCLLAMTACSTANFAYNRAPDFVTGEFEDAFNLNQEQTGLLDSRVRQFFVWHRKEELGRYQDFLKTAAADAHDGLSAAEFGRIVDGIRDAWNRSMTMAIDKMGGLATTLSTEQIEHFEAYYRDTLLDEDNYFDRSEDERRVLRATRSLKRLEGWYGELDGTLEDRVFTRLLKLPNAYDPWLEYREAQITELARIFATAPDPDTMQAQLRYLLLDPGHPLSVEFEPIRAAYWKAYGEMLEDVNSWLTPEQRQKAAARFEGYARFLSGIEPQG